MTNPSTIISRFNGDSLNAQANNSPISSIADLIGSVVGTQTGSARMTLVKNHPDFNGHSVLKAEAAFQQFIDFGDNFDLLTGVTDFILVAKKNAGDMAFFSKVNTSFPAGRYSCMVYSPSGGSLLQGGLYAYDDGSQFGSPVINNTVDLGLTAADTVARVYRLQVDRPAGFLRFYINNVLRAESAANAETLTSLDIAATFRLGMYVSGLELYFDGLIADLAIGRDMSAKDNADFHADLNSTYLTPPPTNATRNTFCVINSMTQGAAESKTLSYPTKLAAAVGANLSEYNSDYSLVVDVTNDSSKTERIWNLGVGGRRVQNDGSLNPKGFLSTIATEIGSRLGLATNNDLYFEGGLNDLGALRPVDDIKADILGTKTYCTNNSIGMYFATLTPIEGSVINTPAIVSYVQYGRKIINSWARTIFPANRFFPFDRNIHLEDPTNRTYYLVDGVHWADPAKVIVTSIIERVRNGTYVEPVVTTSSLPNATQNTAYNQQVAGTGAIASWQDGSDLLPNGLSFNPSTQRYTGTPTEAGNFILRPRAIMSDGTFGQQEIPLTVVSDGSASPINYALAANGGTINSSSNFDGTYVAANANDNNLNGNSNPWLSQDGVSSGNPAILTVVLSQVRTIKEFGIYTAPNSGAGIPPTSTDAADLNGIKDFDIETRATDTGTWVLFQSVVNNTVAYRKFTSSGVDAKQARIVIKGVQTGVGSRARVIEFQVIGIPTTGTPPTNQPPTVNAGGDQTITLPATANLVGTASDDGLPNGSTLVTTWGKVSGAGTVSFGDSAAKITGATFSQAGVYVLRLTATDGVLTATDDVQITVNPVNNTPTNNAPTVNAGVDQTVTLGASVFLNGLVSDDGLPTNSTLSKTWSKISGAGSVGFGNANSQATDVTFSAVGVYVLRLTASDGALTASDDVTITVNAGSPTNTPPTISPISDVAINEDNQSGDIAFTIGDDANVSVLTVTAASSNPALIPNNQANVVLGGAGANRTIKIIPAANQFGSAQITVSVSDGSLTTTRSFLVTVSSVNDVPTISSIADVAINENSQTSPIPFIIGDVETAAGSLTVTAVSSNPTLVPNNAANLVLGGNGANRTIQVIPVSNEFGTAIITVTVSDGVNTASETFVLTVNQVTTPINSAPTISNISDVSTVTTTPVIVPFAVGDAETPASALTVTAVSNNQTLLPNANLVVSGTGANRTLQITAAAGQTGQATVTVRASDGVNTTSKVFGLTVNPPGPTVNTKEVGIFWNEATGNPQGYRVRKTVNGGAPEIINVGNRLEFFDTDIAEGDVLTYEVCAYKGSLQAGWTVLIQKIFTNN